MPIISISQKREWGARFRVINLYLDGEILGYVPNGETKEFDVPVGQHTLKAKTGFFSSKVLSCTMFNKEIKSFTISPNVTHHILLPIIILCLILLQLNSKRIFHSEYTDLIVFPLFLLFSLYSFIIGRNRYLKIKEG